jgi:hypothetical protein
MASAARVGWDTAQCERLILVPDIVSCDLITEYL